MATKKTKAADTADETRLVLALPNVVLDAAAEVVPFVKRDAAYAWGRVSRAGVLRLAVSLGVEELRRRYGLAEGPDAAPVASDEDETAAP